MTECQIEPIFASVGQALFVSFLMEVLPPTQRVSTQILLESIREQSGKTERRVASTMNLGGMSPLEFRGQCAMVRGAARDHLAEPEHAAVRARFGHQQTRAAGVQELAEYLQPLAGIENLLALKALVWSHYSRRSQRAQDRWSLRAIEAETGVSKSTLGRAATVVRDHGRLLEGRAEGALFPLFLRTGLVADPGQA